MVNIMNIEHLKLWLFWLKLSKISYLFVIEIQIVKGHVKRSFYIEIIYDHTSDLGVQAILSNCIKERNFQHTYIQRYHIRVKIRSHAILVPLREREKISHVDLHCSCLVFVLCLCCVYLVPAVWVILGQSSGKMHYWNVKHHFEMLN